MKKEEVHLGDIQRLLFGSAPPEFLVETFIRTMIMYVFLLVIVRQLGKRTKAQLSITEMAVMIMLGAIVSVPMQVPDRGLLQGFVILCVTLFFQRGVTWLGIRRAWIERTTVGTTALLVKDGVLQLDAMRSANISREDLFATLRSRQVINLGMVDRYYLEGCGLVSIYKTDTVKPGLSLLPGQDAAADLHTRHTTQYTCCNCGFVMPGGTSGTCDHCGHYKWTIAII